MKKRPNVESTFVNLRQNQLPESSLTGESDVSVIQDLSPIDIQTSGNAHVILIRPADEASKKMLTSPELLCSALESPPFSSLQLRCPCESVERFGSYSTSPM